MDKEKEYEIAINGTDYEVPSQKVTYEELIALEYPNQPTSDTITYKITFEDAESKPHQGTLPPKGSVDVKKKGTKFDVVQANRS